MNIFFRRIAIMTMAVLCSYLMSAMAHAEIVLQDAAGREVRLAAPARRIVVNDSLLLLSLALIDPDPVGKIAGWAAPRRLDKGIYAAFSRRFPQIGNIPEVGSVMAANAAPEGILSVQPDLFVVSLWQPGWDNVIDILTKANVPILFLDGPANEDRNPAEAMVFSLSLLGKAMGREEKAADYSAFVTARYQMVENRLRNVKGRPKVLIDAFAGAECCSTPGRDNRLTQNIEIAGGEVVGVQGIAGYEGRLNPEAVLGLDPDIYIGTGGSHLARQGGLVLGGGIDEQAARTSLRNVVSQGIRQELTAVREKRAFGISHQLSISALSVLTFECAAKWIHPDLFPNIDPAASLAEVNSRFIAAPLEGTFCIDVGG